MIDPQVAGTFIVEIASVGCRIAALAAVVALLAACRLQRAAAGWGEIAIQPRTGMQQPQALARVAIERISVCVAL